MNQRREELANEKIGRLLFKYSVPAIIGMSVNALYNLVDAIFIGQGVGPTALAALSICFPVMVVMLGIALANGIGTASFVSRAFGRGDDRLAAKASGTSFTFITFVSIVITAGGLAALEPMLRLFGATDQILPYAAEYMSIILISTFFYCFSASGNNLIRAEGNATVAMISMIIGTATNIVLDYVFIFIFGWGISGAAWATVIATMCSFLFQVVYFLSGRSLIRLRPSDLKPDIGIIFETQSIGASSFVRMAAGGFIVIIVNNAIVLLGSEIYLAIMSSTFRLLTFATLPMIGIAQGLQPIIGFNYGARQYKRVTAALHKAIFHSTVVAAISWVLIEVFAFPLLALFSTDAEFLELGQPVMRIMALMQPAFGLIIVGPTLFQALGKALPALLLQTCRQVYLIPMIIVFPLFSGLWGVWFATPVTDLLAAITIYVWVKRETSSLRGLAAVQTEPAVEAAQGQ